MSTFSPTRDALVIGICNYDKLNDRENGTTDLNKATKITDLAKQARKLADLLETQGGFKVTRLPPIELNGRVTLPDLEQAIEKLLYPPESSPTETALLFFAGHGLIKETKLGKEGSLATTEADSKSVYGLSLKNLRELLQRSPVKQLIVFLESCYSGEFLTDFEKVFKEEQRDICFITSTRANEEAVAEGLLTQALLETLDCKKRLEDYITSEMLVKYLRKIEDNNKGGQRFVYRVHGKSILLSGIRREEMKKPVDVHGDAVAGNKIVQNVTGNGSIFSGTGNVRVDKK